MQQAERHAAQARYVYAGAKSRGGAVAARRELLRVKPRWRAAVRLFRFDLHAVAGGAQRVRAARACGSVGR